MNRNETLARIAAVALAQVYYTQMARGTLPPVQKVEQGRRSLGH